MPKGIYKRTKSIRKSLSEKRKGIIFSEKHKNSLKLAVKNRSFKCRSLASKKAWVNNFKKMNKQLECARKNIIYKPLNDKIKKKISKTLKNRWSNIDKIKKVEMLNNWIIAGQSSSFGRNTSIEKKIHNVLNLLNVKYITHCKIANFYPDIYVPEEKLIIECNGNYWHNLSRVKKRDKQLQDYCDKNKIRLIWLWEDAIKNNPQRALERGFENVKENKIMV